MPESTEFRHSELLGSGGYFSPFDRIVDLSPTKENPFLSSTMSAYSEALKYQEYEGTLDSLFLELSDALYSPQLTYEQAMIVALHPPRLLRAIINYVADQEISDKKLLVETTTNLAIKIYSNPETALPELEEFKQHLHRLHPDLFLADVKQKFDRLEWMSLNPETCSKSADQIDAFSGSGDITFVALAHGGVTAGLDVFLRYLQKTGAKSSTFLPIRFSKRKLKETKPNILPEDVSHLQDTSETQPLILFDSDRSSTHITQSINTIEAAAKFFFEEVSPLAKILLITNYGPEPEQILLGYKEDDIWYNQLGALKAVERVVTENTLTAEQRNLLQRIISSNEDSRVIELAQQILRKNASRRT